MAEELGWRIEDFDKAFGEISRQGMVEADFTARVMWLPSAIKHNKPASPNVVKSWAADFDLIPECDLKWKAFGLLHANIQALGDAYAKAFSEAFAKPLECGYSKAVAKTSSNQEQEQQQQQQRTPGASAPLSSASQTTLPDDGLLPPKTNTPPCPFKHLLALFVAKVPEMPRPRIEMWKDSAGEEAMRQRWKWLLSAEAVREDGTRYAENADQAVEWFGRFFDNVHESDFLTGRTSDRCKFDLAWLMKRNNFMKVVQGNYSNKDKAAP
jgi:hypothetical protein